MATVLPSLYLTLRRRADSDDQDEDDNMTTKILKGGITSSVVTPADWFDPHPWEEIKPYLLLGGIAMFVGLMMVGRSRTSSPWMRTPSKVLYLLGITLLVYSGLLATPSDATKGIMFMLAVILVPVCLILTSVYVFGHPGALSGSNSGQRAQERSEGSEEESVPLRDVEAGLKD